MVNQSPLADRMRPQNLNEFVGQEHILGADRALRKIIEQDHTPSMIFWGPPGSGKTTLARIIANETNSIFRQISAVLAGVKDIREIVAEARQRHEFDNRHTILFIDEIHRFSKAQQDSLLPHVEDGTITLIGATTENPSFEVNNALLSRTRVFVLEQLTADQLVTVITSALSDTNRGLGKYNIDIDNETVKLIAQAANGDARTALNALELAVEIAPKGPKDLIAITPTQVKEALQKSLLQYDRTGDEHYNTISAFIKSMRAGDKDAAIYYLVRMVEAGEDAKFIARRMVIFASEDIGLAQPTALVVANAVFRACETVGYPECTINLAHGAAYLSQCPKNRSAYDALGAAQSDIKIYGNLPIPLELRNAPTELMKELGYGKDYVKYPQGKSLLPKTINGKRYFSD